MVYTQTMSLFTKALRISIPVLLGYLAIGVAFGLLLADAGYPWTLALVMGLLMYAGTGQYIAVGLFAAGAGLWECVLVQLVVNARHIAYGLSMQRRFRDAGKFKFYLIFALTDETFALLSSLDKEKSSPRLMFYIALLNHFYWTAGSVIGAVAGTLLPFSMKGVNFALTALFIVLMIEQIRLAKEKRSFIISAAVTIPAVFFLPGRFSLLGALAFALILIPLTGKKEAADVEP
ncbi:branched-chain amino acid ABC transporter permease [Spirochaetia bacterium]|nr:branched-chain amino acid ABC transporter permease [Spirochaetia bacterium]